MIYQAPKISVIAVSFNHESYVLQTLESIKEQSFKDFEIIYCDDCSEDGSARLALSWLDGHYPNAKRIINQENRGLCKTLNAALSCAEGEFVQIIACDDVLMPKKFELQVPLFDEDEQVAVVCSDFSMIDERGELLGSSYFGSGYDLPEYVFDKVLDCRFGGGTIIHSPTALVRRQAYTEVGNYDERMYQEDYDMWLRISREFKVRYVASATVQYRKVTSSLSNSRAYKLVRTQDALLALVKHDDHPIYAGLVRKRITECVDRICHAVDEFDASKEARFAELLCEIVKSRPQVMELVVASWVRHNRRLHECYGSVLNSWTFGVGRVVLFPVRRVVSLVRGIRRLIACVC